jgi:signal transduction histidine kinase
MTNITLSHPLAETLKSIVALLDLETVARRVARAALTLAQARETALLVLDEAGATCFLVRATLDDEQVNRRGAVVDPATAQVIRTGARLALSEQMRLYLPLKVGQVVVGVLDIRAPSADQAQPLLEVLADWAGPALRNAQLYAASQARSRGLELATNVAQIVSGTLDLEQIPRLLIQRTAKIFGAETGSLALIDKERDSVVFQLAYDDAGNELKGMKDFLMPLGEGIAGIVAQTGELRLVNDARNHPEWSPLADRLTGFQTRNLMAVPLVAGGQILGVIEILNKREGDFTETDLQLLAVIAASTAIAIQNARQYVALKQANETLGAFQAQRIASERWAVLGKAAGSLAHRINNSTTLVPLACEQLRELLAGVTMPPALRQEVEAKLDRIERNTLYTVELARILMRRFRSNPARAHDVNELVKRALALVELPAGIKVTQHLDPDLPPVDTSDLLIDVFVELISNAVHAMTGTGGVLRVATFRSGSDTVSIQITDSGPGIPKENLQRVFDMFFTTDPEGLGFGLWWVKTFLEQQHGLIEVESRPDEGTTFTVTLPRRLPPGGSKTRRSG